MTYSKTNFKLIPLIPNTKRPRDKGWQEDTYVGTDFTNQIGLAHKYSGTCSVDLDDYAKCVEIFNARGIDLNALCINNVGILSGKSNHYKLLFKLDKPLQTKKILIDKNTILELRCMTSEGLSVQDVIPPSMHPDTGKPYEWRGDYNNLVELPESIKTWWLELIGAEQQDIEKSKVDTSWAEIDKMLSVIPADISREQWLSVAMGIHHFDYLSSEKLGYSKFLEWSKTGEDSFKDERDIKTTWNSIKVSANGIGVGSLFNIAYEYGYVKDKKHLFTGVDNTVDNSVDKSVDNPADIITELRLKEPDLDLNLLPDIVRQYATELSSTIGADPLGSAFAMIVAISGLVDGRSRLHIVDGFEVPPLLWCMTIGDPSCKKSPATKPVFTVFKEIEREDKAEYAKQRMVWEGKEIAFNEQKKDYLEACKQGLLVNDAVSKPPEVIEPPPVPLRLTVGDITSQQLVRHCALRPQGTLCYLDEMVSWVDKIVDKNSNEDRAAWLMGYNSDQYELDRVGSGSTYCENIAVSLFGTIQPRVLTNSIDKLSKDGIMQRFIPIILRRKFNAVGDPIPKEMSVKPQWDNTARIVHTLNAITYRLSTDAYKVFREFQEWIHQYKEQNVDNFSGNAMTTIGKLEGVVGRLSLVFHLIEQPHSSEVNADIVTRVVDVVKTLIIPSYLYVFNETSGATSENLKVWLTEHILVQSLNHTTISLRDIKRSSFRLFKKIGVTKDYEKSELILNVMLELEAHNWVTLVSETRTTAVWSINSKLSTMFQKQRDEIVLRKQAELNTMQKKAKVKKKVDGYDEALNRSFKMKIHR
jgi:hypothetical protein